MFHPILKLSLVSTSFLSPRAKRAKNKRTMRKQTDHDTVACKESLALTCVNFEALRSYLQRGFEGINSRSHR
jgi:hypothetical protein